MVTVKGSVAAGDKDQRLVGVGLGEVNSHLHRVRQGQGVMDGGGGGVGVAGPVDFAALAHEEEALVVVQNLDALLHVVGQGSQLFRPIQLIDHGGGVGQVLVNQDYGAGGDLFRLGLGLDYRAARLLRQRVRILNGGTEPPAHRLAGTQMKEERLCAVSRDG